MPATIDLARLIALRRETDISPDRRGSPEPRRIVDDGGIGEGDHDTDAGGARPPLQSQLMCARNRP
jgi:hypothetical protein